MSSFFQGITESLESADWVTIVTAFFSVMSVIVIAFLTNKISKKANGINKDANKINIDANEINKKLGELGITTQDKQRFIGTVSVQRVEWINNIRHNFAELNKRLYIRSNVIKNIKDDSYEPTFEEEYIFPEIVYYKNLMELYLNPTEIVSKKLITITEDLTKYFTEYKSSDFNIIYAFSESNKILYLQQVILKAEWKRLKIETDLGKQINDEEMNKIFKEVAKEINIETYNLLLKNSFE